MRIYVAKDYHDMSRKAANIVSAQVIMKPNCVLGLATGSTPEGIYAQLTDWYNKSVQVFTPSKMEIVFGEETHITSDAVFKYDDIQPLGLLAYGGELLMSVQKSGKIQRYDPETGDLLGVLAEFPGKEIGRMEIARGMLYYIDLKAGKLMKAKGE